MARAQARHGQVYRSTNTYSCANQLSAVFDGTVGMDRVLSHQPAAFVGHDPKQADVASMLNAMRAAEITARRS